MNTTTKVCTHCNIEKPLTGYHKSRGTFDGTLNRCMQCWNTRKNELYRLQVKAGAFGLCKDCKKPLSVVGRGRKFPYCKGCLNGENSPHWKGGHLTQHGYIVMRRSDHSPTFEHRIVMEKYLGRRLYDDETVHHKNGVRSDNRIENLELWVGAHPRGLKVKEAIDWANEIIERYT